MSSKAVKERLRKLRQKYGLGEYSKNKNKRRRVSTRSVGKMARFRKAKRYARRGAGILNEASKGIGYAVLVNRFGSGVLGQYTGIASLGAAYYGGGVMGAVGSVLVGAASLGSIGVGNSSNGSW